MGDFERALGRGGGPKLKGTRFAQQSKAVAEGGWGFKQLLHPQRSGLAGAVHRGIAGAPGIGEQVANIVESAPSGFLNLAEGVATDPLAAAGAGAAIGSALPGAGTLAGGVIGGVVGTAGYGLKKLLGDDSNPDPLATSREFLHSFERTAQRGSALLTGNNPYAKASRRGELVASLVEDLANVSMVAHGAGKALDVGVGGAASRALEAESTMRAAQKATSAAAENATRLAKEAAVPGMPEAAKALKLSEAADAAKSVAQQTRIAQDAASTLARERAGAGSAFGAYKGLRKVSTLGGKGANLPAEVWLGAPKLIRAAVQRFGPDVAEALGRSDAGQALVAGLAHAREVVGGQLEKHRLLGHVGEDIHAGETQARVETEPINQLRVKLNEAVPDPVEQQAAMAQSLELPRLIAQVGEDAGPDIVQPLIEDLTGEHGFFGLSPEGLRMAVDYEKGALPPEVMARINEGQQLHRAMMAPVEQGYADQRGLAPHEQGPEVAAQREWQATGTTPNPTAVGRAAGRREAVLGAQGEKVKGAKQRVEREAGRRVFTDEQLRQPVRAAQADVAAAMTVGEQFVAQHGDIAAQLFPGHEGHDLERAIADATLVSRAGGLTGSLPPELQHVIDAQTWTGETPIVGSLGGTKKLIGQGAHEGAAQATGKLAGRLKDVATTTRARADQARGRTAEARSKIQARNVERVTRAVKRVEQSKRRAEAAMQRAQKLSGPERERAITRAKAGIEKDIRAARGEVRSALLKASDDRLLDLYDELGGWFPSSHRKWLRRVDRGEGVNIRHPSIDFWNRLTRETDMPSIVTRPPKWLRGGLSLDELISNFRSRHPRYEGLSDDAVMGEIIGRINDATAGRRDVNGLVSRGFVADGQVRNSVAEILAREGYDGWQIEHEILPRMQGSLSEAAAREMQGQEFNPVTPAVRDRVLKAVEDARAVEREGGTPEIPKWTPAKRDGLTPFERSLADVVMHDARVTASEKQLGRLDQTIMRRAFDDAVSRGLKTGRLEGKAVGLERAARAAEGASATAERAAARGGTARVSQGAGLLGGRGMRAGLREGRVDARLSAAMRDLGVQERIYGRLDDLTKRQVEEAHTTLRNAPARYKPLLAGAREAATFVEDRAKKLDELEAGSGDALREIAAEIPVTLAKAVEGGYDPEYSIGGDVAKPTGTGRNREATLPSVRKGGERFERAALHAPASADEAAALASRRISDWVRNETAYKLQARFGIAPAQVLGEPPDAHGIDVTPVIHAHDAESRATALTALRAEAKRQGFQLLEGEGNQFALLPGRLRSGQGLIDAMEKEGYVQWDPTQLFGKRPRQRVDVTTIFVPKAVWDRFSTQLGPAGRSEQFFRRFYDKPLRLWKDQVLALSPRWNVNNIIGGVVTATAGGGVNPGVYVRNFARGWEILRAFGDEKKIVELEAKDPEAAQVARTMDPRMHQASEGAALGDIKNLDLEQRLPKRAATTVGRGYKRITNASYAWNGFVDDANRLSVFLSRRESLTPRQMSEWIAKDPTLARIGHGSTEALRDEIAVRESLKVVGDFTRLTPIERQVVRRILPFYPWMRHITKLALRMPLTDPVRTAWLMHLAATFGEPPEFGFLGAYVPLGPEDKATQERDFLHIGRVNPFGDPLYGSGGSADYSVGNIPANIGSSLTPALTAPLGLATGLDVRNWNQITRPTGSGNLDAYGRDTFTPLLDRPGEAFAFLGNYVPGYRIGRAALDGLEYGGKLPLRYANGQVMKSQGHPILSDRPWYAPALDLTGIPATGPERIGLSELRGRRDERQRRAAASRRRYAGTTSEPVGLAAAWGARKG